MSHLIPQLTFPTIINQRFLAPIFIRSDLASSSQPINFAHFFQALSLDLVHPTNKSKFLAVTSPPVGEERGL